MKKIAIISGGSGGIGGMTAEILAKKGYVIALLYNNNYTNALAVKERIEKSCPKNTCLLYKCDISRKNEVEKLVVEISKEGEIFILVNNAGVALNGLFQDATEQEIDNVFNINVKGMFFLTQPVLKVMINQKFGRIINISSVWGEVGGSCESIYSASKAAVIGFTKALAKEVAPCNITVNCVSPGVIETNMLSNLSEDCKAALAEETPVGRLGTPYDVARVIDFLADSNSDFITGQNFSINGGFFI